MGLEVSEPASGEVRNSRISDHGVLQLAHCRQLSQLRVWQLPLVTLSGAGQLEAEMSVSARVARLGVPVTVIHDLSIWSFEDVALTPQEHFEEDEEALRGLEIDDETLENTLRLRMQALRWDIDMGTPGDEHEQSFQAQVQEYLEYIFNDDVIVNNSILDMWSAAQAMHMHSTVRKGLTVDGFNFFITSVTISAALIMMES